VFEGGDELFNLPSVNAKVKREALALNCEVGGGRE
jgi:hypothetical protein